MTGVQTCALPISLPQREPGQYKKLGAAATRKGHIKTRGAAATKTGQYKKWGAAATRSWQYKKPGRCRNEKWAVKKARSEERREGKECRSRWSPDH